MHLPRYISEDRYIYYSLPWLWLAYLLTLGVSAMESAIACLVALGIYHGLKLFALWPEMVRERKSRKLMAELEESARARRQEVHRKIDRFYQNGHAVICCYGKHGFGTRCHRPATKRTTFQGLSTEMVWCEDHYPKLRNNGYDLVDL